MIEGLPSLLQGEARPVISNLSYYKLVYTEIN